MEFSKNFWGEKFWNKKEAFSSNFFSKKAFFLKRKRKALQTQGYSLKKIKLFVFLEIFSA